VAKHTPGPWKCEQSGYANAPFVVFTGEVSPKWNRRYPLTGVNWIAEVRDDESEQHPEWEANARLIQKAPELLDVLKKLVAELKDTCVSDIESGDAVCVSLDEAKRIIAETGGETWLS